MIITVSTRSRHWTLSYARWIQSTPSSTIHLESARLRLVLPSGLFPPCILIKILKEFVTFPMTATCPAHAILLQLKTLKIWITVSVVLLRIVHPLQHPDPTWIIRSIYTDMRSTWWTWGNTRADRRLVTSWHTFRKMWRQCPVRHLWKTPSLFHPEATQSLSSKQKTLVSWPFGRLDEGAEGNLVLVASFHIPSAPFVIASIKFNYPGPNFAV
jgi:hypothetical protein